MQDNQTLIGARTTFGCTLPVYDAGFGQAWLYREAGGLCGVVRALTWQDAYECAQDELMTRVNEEEVLDAYGLYVIEQGDWHWLCPDFETDDARWENFDYEIPGRPILERYVSRVDAEVAGKRYIGEHELELAEGYEYQPNGTGTGIVSIDLNGQDLRPLDAALRSELGITLQVTQS